MRAFASDGAAFVAHLEPAERAVLLRVVDDVLRLLGHAPDAPAARGDALDAVRMSAGPVAVPDDPALLRLLPPASHDAETAAELRRLTEQDLRSTKRGQLRRLRAGLDAAGPDLVVVASEAPAVAAALTDVRLVVAERLGVRSDADSDAVYARVVGGRGSQVRGGPAGAEDDVDGADAERVALLSAVHVVLGVLQESLVGLMLEALDEPQDDGGVGPALGSHP